MKISIEVVLNALDALAKENAKNAAYTDPKFTEGYARALKNIRFILTAVQRQKGR